MSALERNPPVPKPTPHKVLGPGIDGYFLLKPTSIISASVFLSGHTGDISSLSIMRTVLECIIG